MELFRLPTLLSVLVFFSSSVPAATMVRAQEEARAAWQVTRFDITADFSAGGAERGLTARALLDARNVGQGTGRTFTVRFNPTVEVRAASVGGAAAQFISRTEPRTKLQQVTVTLPAPVVSGGAVSVALEYRFPVGENSGLAAISDEGSQFLPLSYWYPTPNTQFAPRGVDAAPARLTVNAGAGEMVVSSGAANGASFDQPLNAQPFFLTGKWDVIDGGAEARGISAWLHAGAPPEARRRAEALISLAAAARTFYAELIGGAAAPAVPMRLVAVRRGAGFDMAGTLLLEAAVFDRTKTDSATALLIAEAVARLWIGGATAVGGEGAGVVREGLARYLATLFFEKQFGRNVAEAERMRMALLYAPIARRDGPLATSTPFFDTHFNAVVNKGALIWRLIADRVIGPEAFAALLKREFQPRADGRVSLASLRAALAERGGEPVRRILEGAFDQPTDTDLLIGLPQQQQPGEWVAALRNTGSLPAEVTVVATTEGGERLTTNVLIPPRDFAEARFKTTARLARAEVDPDKLYPQLDYSNDVAPRAPSTEEAIAEARTLFTQQQYGRAAEAARAVLRRMPQAQEARLLLGRALVEGNNIAEAEKEFRAALDAPLPTPATLAWANIGLGEIALRRTQAAEAARRFDEAVRAGADYASTLAARNGRLRAEAAAGTPPPPDESVRAFVAQFDQAVLGGRKIALEALIVPGELADFVRGIVGNQPEVWQTRVLRTEAAGANRLLADVAVTTKALGRDQSGTAVFVLARSGSGWRLADIQFFEVR